MPSITRFTVSANAPSGIKRGETYPAQRPSLPRGSACRGQIDHSTATKRRHTCPQPLHGYTASSGSTGDSGKASGDSSVVAIVLLFYASCSVWPSCKSTRPPKHLRAKAVTASTPLITSISPTHTVDGCTFGSWERGSADVRPPSQLDQQLKPSSPSVWSRREDSQLPPIGCQNDRRRRLRSVDDTGGMLRMCRGRTGGQQQRLNVVDTPRPGGRIVTGRGRKRKKGRPPAQAENRTSRWFCR